MRSGERSTYMPDSIATAYVQIEPTFGGIAQKLKGGMAPAANEAGKDAGGSFGQGFASVIGGATKAVVGVIAGAAAAGAGAVAGLTKSATAAFGEYEQLVGGVDTLFGDASSKVQENAAKAFATAGMSANEYMSNVTAFSASLLQSLGGDTAKAADVADMAMRDMSDNANKMGSSMESITMAYQGFAKGQYQLLDNLKLGYGGSKTEMQRLLQDAEKLSGVKYDISSLNDVYEAIHVVQQEMGITGTTAKEAATTLEGSFASMGAAWQNVVTSLGSGENLESNITTFVSTAEQYINNLIPIIEQSLGGISQLIEQLAPVIAEKLPVLVEKIVPSLLQAAGQLVSSLGSALEASLPTILTTGMDVLNELIQGFLQALPQLMPMVMTLLTTLTQFIIENLPLLIEAAAQIILGLATGLAEALPQLIPTIVEVVMNIALYLVENVDLLIDAALQLMIGLAEGLINALPVLIEKAPIIIAKLNAAFLNAIPKLLEAGVKIIKVIIDGLVKTVPMLIKEAPKLIEDLKKNFLAAIPKIVEVGKNIVEGIKQGIEDAWSALTSWFTDKMKDLVDSVADFLKIGSPSKLMADEIGRWIPAGIAEGINNGMGVLDKEINAMTADMVQTAINPTILSQYAPQTQSDDLGEVLDILRAYLPQIAAKAGQKVVLEGDAGRLFRVIQRESIRNTELVGTGAVLSAT